MSLILFKNIYRLYGTHNTTERYNIWYKQCYRIESTQQNYKITVCVFPLFTMKGKILHRTFQYNYIAIQSRFYILLCECKGKGMTADKV